MSDELTAVLLRSGALSSTAIARSLGQAQARNMSLWDLLMCERQIPEETLADAFSAHLNVPRVRIDRLTIEAAVLQAVAARLARKHTCLPIRLHGKVLVLAMANPLDRQAIQDVEFTASRTVRAVVACRSEILAAIQAHYGAAADRDDAPFEAPLPAGDRQSVDPSSAVELCSRIILDALAAGASDIHIEPGPLEMGIRFRVDGVLRDHLRLPGWMHGALVSRIKVLARLDIAQQRLPQDGRIRMDAQGRAIDLRVSTLPTHLGEKAVLRVLGSANVPALGGLGLSKAELDHLDAALAQPQGLILVTGPTGAGKSTTLYSMLMRRHSPEVNIVTIEDPIEYRVPGTSQVQVDPKAGLTFAGSLRAILRQDPDVILVGEIRDGETAEIAFQAALTGHLVFTTLHTNDSIGAIERLRDLGVKPVLLTSATNLIVAQRLARRVCAACAAPYIPARDVLDRLRLAADQHTFTRGRGCDACGQTGYAGRVGIFEILRLTPRLRDLILRQAPEAQLRRAAASAGTRFLIEDAVAKVRAGLTTVEEVVRVIRIEEDHDVRAPRREKTALPARSAVERS